MTQTCNLGGKRLAPSLTARGRCRDRKPGVATPGFNFPPELKADRQQHSNNFVLLGGSLFWAFTLSDCPARLCRSTDFYYIICSFHSASGKLVFKCGQFGSSLSPKPYSPANYTRNSELWLGQKGKPGFENIFIDLHSPCLSMRSPIII